MDMTAVKNNTTIFLKTRENVISFLIMYLFISDQVYVLIKIGILVLSNNCLLLDTKTSDEYKGLLLKKGIFP